LANAQKASKDQLILNAQRAGFQVTPNEEGNAWLVITPRASRRPSQTLGDFTSPERAWMAAALLAQQ
jgi:hypothetical protein